MRSDTVSEALQYLPAVLMGMLQVLYTAYLIPLMMSPLTANPRKRSKEQLRECRQLPSVAAVIPVYREDFKSLMRTASSIARQNYPKELIHAFIVVEDDDEVTLPHMESVRKYLESHGIKTDVVRVRCGRRFGKPCALNEALKLVSEDIFLVFDADDDVPEDYIALAVKPLCNDYVAVTTKVYRVGRRLGAKFLTLDTLIWYDVALPSLIRMGECIPLSGEGLAVKTDYLRRVGGFPLSLAEDAYLAVLIARDGGKVAYLRDTYIVERAPKTFISQVRQKIRWTQGYFECLTLLTKTLLKGKLGLRKSLPLLMPYFSPITSIATLITHTLFIVYWVAFVAGLNSVTSAYTLMFPAPVFYWGLFNTIVGNTYLIYLTLYLVSDTRFSRLAPYTLLMPLYWYLIGAVVLVALLTPRYWRKTER